MKKYLSLVLSLLLVFGVMTVFCSAADGVVLSDPDGLISQEGADSIKSVCSSLSNSNGCNVRIHIAKTLSGESCESYAQKLFDSENFGGNERCGVVFVIAVDDGDYYMKAGGGISAHLTYDDIVSLLRGKFEPDFAAGETERALTATVYALCNRLSEYTPEKIAEEQSEKGKTNPLLIIFIVIMLLAFLCVVVFVILYIRAERIRKKRRRRRPGNGRNNRPVNRNVRRYPRA